MTIKDFVSALSGGSFDSLLRDIYGDDIIKQKVRLTDACERFSRFYPERNEIHVFSVPVCKNVNGIPFFIADDMIAVVAFHEDGIVRIQSDSTDIIKPNGSFDAYIMAGSLKISEFSDELTGAGINGYNLCITDMTEKADINNNYTPVSLNEDDFFSNFAEISSHCSDNQLLSSVIEYDRIQRENDMREAVAIADTEEFFRLINESPALLEQSAIIKTAVLMGRKILARNGAVNVSDEFIQAFVPSYIAEEYTKKMNDFFGKTQSFGIRTVGRCEIK